MAVRVVVVVGIVVVVADIGTYLFSIYGVFVWDYYLLAVLVGDDGIQSLSCCF